MNLAELLHQVIDIKGVSSAAVVSGEGFIIEGVSNNETDLGFVGGLIASGLASSRVLAKLLGDGVINQTMIEYEHGPVLMIPLEEAEDGFVMVATLESTTVLGRARFQLRKLIPEIIKAIAA
jgi:predicted regulator of Ras-like GTPase activity (Roadblock/LC7/MglB family)